MYRTLHIVAEEYLHKEHRGALALIVFHSWWDLSYYSTGTWLYSVGREGVAEF